MKRTGAKKSARPGRRGQATRAKERRALNEMPRPQIRSSSGRFLPGQSANPGGRPTVATELRDAAQRYGPEALKHLVKWMRSPDPIVSLTAIRLMLERGFGKPIQPVTGPDGAPLSLVNVGVITDAAQAALVYAEIIGRPDADLTGLRFAAPAQLAAPDPAPEPLPGDES
jgi:hypothetical protein